MRAIESQPRRQQRHGSTLYTPNPTQLLIDNLISRPFGCNNGARPPIISTLPIPSHPLSRYRAPKRGGRLRRILQIRLGYRGRICGTFWQPHLHFLGLLAHIIRLAPAFIAPSALRAKHFSARVKSSSFLTSSLMHCLITPLRHGHSLTDGMDLPT